jgi:AcrR family transcriptional regulator
MSVTKNPPPPLEPIPGKRARTRQKLIEAASALIREKGFANVSMEDVAARAGVSRGSIYGNFRDRNDLIVAVAAMRTPQIMPTPTSGASLGEQMRTMGQAVAKAATAHRHDTVYWAAFMLHALSDETLRQRAETQNRSVRRQMIEAWSKALPADRLPMPAETFIKVLMTLTNGLIMAHSMSPDDFSEDVIVAAFEALGTRNDC